MSDQLTISIFNAIGLPRPALDSLLAFTPSSDLLFVTETRLLSPYRYYTSWTQHHVYCVLPHPESRKGSRGISLFVNPSCTYHVRCIPDSSDFSPYHLSCIVANTLIHCVYLPPSLPDETALAVLQLLTLYHPNTNRTILCGDFNTRLGSIAGTIARHHAVLCYYPGSRLMVSLSGTQSLPTVSPRLSRIMAQAP